MDNGNAMLIFYDIKQEIERAETKHPNWPKDTVYAAAIVAEEAGEVIRAALQLKMEDGDITDVVEELIQTAATCFRMLNDIMFNFESTSTPRK